MASNHSELISPCPFSKGYKIPVEHAWSLLKVFFIYRFIISSLFVIVLYNHFDHSFFTAPDLNLLSMVSHSYLVFSIVSGVCVFKQVFNYTSQAQAAVFSDILFITLLMHASGGINSGIGILLAISIASGGVLIGGHCALLFAALASIAVLTEQIYTYQNVPHTEISFTYAGMLGISFFTIALLSFILAKRTEQSEKLAIQHRKTILNLEELNNYIIQHLQSGIIICGSDQQIKMCNSAALTICAKKEDRTKWRFLADISTSLSDSFLDWVNDANQNLAVIDVGNKSEVHARFSLLNTRLEAHHMIILEDVALYNQRLQQSKLASLGFLTASIAHEIRNPLGAISHAGQLLSESVDIPEQDQRLTEIILAHCDRVNRIIEDVLQLSRRQPSKRKKVELIAWLQDYLHHFMQVMECAVDQFGLSSLENKIQVDFDTDHLKQILDNLCANALKYGAPEKGKIFLEVGVYKGHCYINILDHAPMIKPEVVRHLFEPFYTTSTTGTGLGLYISKELAELNQAKLGYALSHNNHYCFTLSIPSVNQSTIEI